MRSEYNVVEGPDEFALKLVDAASIPPSRRGDGNHVIVRGNVEVLPRVDGADQVFYEIRAEFTESVHGDLGTVARYSAKGNYNEKEDGAFDDAKRNEVLSNFLNSLSSRVGSHNPHLGRSVDQGCLVVQSVRHSIGIN